MRIDEKILNTLLEEKEPVSGKKLAFTLNISEKTVMKYLSAIKAILPENGATLVTKQRVGSSIVVHDPEKFNLFLARQKSTAIFEDPILRKKYILVRLLLAEEYISIYDLAEEISVSPSLLRSILKDLKSIVHSYNLELQHSHFNGYRIVGSETDTRQCLSHEFKSFSSDSLIHSKLQMNAKDTIHQIIANVLEHFHISVSSESIQSLTLHVLIAINRIETSNYVQLPDNYKALKIRATPEYYAAAQIGKQLEETLHISLNENELVYLTMHITGQQRVYGHEELHFSISQKALVFYNRFLRAILQYSEEDFFSDEELRTSLLNHIVPFLSRIENHMQIEKSELNNIKNEFPYAYDLAVAGLSVLEKDGYLVNEIEVSYFALHLQLAMEKRKQSENIQYNVLIFSEEASSVFHMISYKLSHHFGDKINEVVFLNPKDSYVASEFQLLIDTTNSYDLLPPSAIHVSPYMNESDLAIISDAFHRLESRIINTVMLRESLFFTIEANNRKEALTRLIDQIQNHFSLPADFYERIEKREALASTEYDNRIAIPHPMNCSDIFDFIAVTRLTKPILWHSKQVQLIFLICNHGIPNTWFYSKISRIIRDPALSQNLLNATTFQSFQDIFEKI